MSLPDAMAKTGITDLEANVHVSMTRAQSKLADDLSSPQPQWQALSQDEVSAINLYTQQSEFYPRLNAALRDQNREQIVPFLPYLRLLVQGLLKLPAHSKTVFRGVKQYLSDTFRQNRDHGCLFDLIVSGSVDKQSILRH